MKLRLRIANSVDTTKMFSAVVRGGVRGYGDSNALETHSNDVAPCIRTTEKFVLIVEPHEQQTGADDREGQTSD